MDTNESLTAISKFIVEYSSRLMAAGVHTSRVVRNSKRIGEALGTEVKMSVLQKRNLIETAGIQHPFMEPEKLECMPCQCLRYFL